MFTNRLISPLSSQTRSLSPGNCRLSDSIMDWMSEAVASTSFFPPVNGRRGVGMRTFTMWSSPLVFAQVERLLELRQARGNPRRPADGVHHGLLGFEAVARDKGDRRVGPFDDALFDQLLENADGHAACRLGEDALGLREEHHALHDLLVGDGVHGPAALGGGLERVIAVGGIADGK